MQNLKLTFDHCINWIGAIAGVLFLLAFGWVAVVYPLSHKGRMPWMAPAAIFDSELNSMDLPFIVGDTVFIRSGPFKGAIGSVTHVDGFTGYVTYRVVLDSGPEWFREDALVKHLPGANHNRTKAPDSLESIPAWIRWLPLNEQRIGD